MAGFDKEGEHGIASYAIPQQEKHRDTLLKVMDKKKTVNPKDAKRILKAAQKKR